MNEDPVVIEDDSVNPARRLGFVAGGRAGCSGAQGSAERSDRGYCNRDGSCRAALNLRCQRPHLTDDLSLPRRTGIIDFRSYSFDAVRVNSVAVPRAVSPM